jgi:uncharacterized protein YjiK
VQDETVRVYEFDLSSQAITQHVKHKYGDSEDVVIIDNTAYLLHAGDRPAIYKLTGYNSGSAEYERYALDLDKAYDPEGLTYDAKGNRLLIACKGSPIKDDLCRKIFSFDLASDTMQTTPVFIIDSRDFLNKPDEIFHPAGIAIHPTSNDIYLVGTRSVKMVVCYGDNGELKGAWGLDKKQFIQPEGIAFTESGNLIICSEGVKKEKGKKGKKARICLFDSTEA